MTLAVIVAGLVLALFGLLLWDALRRSLAAQLRRTELRFDAVTRGELDAIRSEVAELRKQTESLASALVLKGGRR